jgi:hypothetical protein
MNAAGHLVNGSALSSPSNNPSESNYPHLALSKASLVGAVSLKLITRKPVKHRQLT